eukprot:53492_1
MKPWIANFVETNLRGYHTASDTFNAIMYGVSWSSKIKKNIVSITDGTHSIQAYFSNRAFNNNQQDSYTKNTLFKIKCAKIKINESFDKVYLIIYECLFSNLQLTTKQYIDINTNKNIQNLILNNRR